MKGGGHFSQIDSSAFSVPYNVDGTGTVMCYVKKSWGSKNQDFYTKDSNLFYSLLHYTKHGLGFKVILGKFLTVPSI